MAIDKDIIKMIEKNKKCWENFILQCEKLGYGIFQDIKVQNGAPIYIKKSEKGIDLTKDSK